MNDIPKLRKTYIHPTAEVHPSAVIGEGVLIWNWSKIRERVSIGAATNIAQNVYLDLDTRVGARCKLQNGVNVFKGVVIGDDVFVGPSATFTNDMYPRSHDAHWNILSTIVEDGVSIGAGTTIICDVRLGRHCMIGAGSVILKDVPPFALVVGNPARIIDYVTISGKRVGWKPGQPVPGEKILVDKKLDFDRSELQS